MNTTVFHFIEELGKCSHNPLSGIQEYTYNGISIRQGTETYTLILNEQFTQFKNDVIELDENKLKVILNELYCKKVQYFDVPTEEDIARMKYDFQYSQTRSFKNDIDMAVFARDMYLIQQWYIEEAIKFISSLLPKETPNEAAKPNHDTKQERKTIEQRTEIKRKDYMSLWEMIDYFDGKVPQAAKSRKWRKDNKFPIGNTGRGHKLSFKIADIEKWIEDKEKKRRI